MLPGLIKCNANEDPGKDSSGIIFMRLTRDDDVRRVRVFELAELHERLIAGHFPGSGNFPSNNAHSKHIHIYVYIVAQSLSWRIIVDNAANITDNSP